MRFRYCAALLGKFGPLARFLGSVISFSRDTNRKARLWVEDLHVSLWRLLDDEHAVIHPLDGGIERELGREVVPSARDRAGRLGIGMESARLRQDEPVRSVNQALSHY
jgi:hypothetical protein